MRAGCGGLGTKTFLYRKPYKTQTSSAQNLKSSKEKGEKKKQKRKCSVKKKSLMSSLLTEPALAGGVGLAGVRVWWPLPCCDPVDRMWHLGCRPAEGGVSSQRVLPTNPTVFLETKRLKPAAEDEAILSSVSLKGPGTELLRYARYQLADENQSRSFVSAASWPERILYRMVCGAEGKSDALSSVWQALRTETLRKEIISSSTFSPIMLHRCFWNVLRCQGSQPAVQWGEEEEMEEEESLQDITSRKPDRLPRLCTTSPSLLLLFPNVLFFSSSVCIPPEKNWVFF